MTVGTKENDLNSTAVKTVSTYITKEFTLATSQTVFLIMTVWYIIVCLYKLSMTSYFGGVITRVH